MGRQYIVWSIKGQPSLTLNLDLTARLRADFTGFQIFGLERANRLHYYQAHELLVNEIRAGVLWHRGS
jgi:hypothetical protein